jgi:uncharacterized beta-barrel protein YwiB (DUF1934 family)
MPKKRNVKIQFQGWQQDGDPQRAMLKGALFRQTTGWALTYLDQPDENGVETLNTLFIRDGELLVRRRGSLFFEQVFRRDVWLTGHMETPFGAHAIQAFTTRLDSELSENGGHIEWTYDLRVQDQESGSFRIRLDIQGE